MTYRNFIIAVVVSYTLMFSIAHAQKHSIESQISLRLNSISEGDIFLLTEDVSGYSKIDTFINLGKGNYTASTQLNTTSTLTVYSNYLFLFSFYATPGTRLIIKADVSSFDSKRRTISVYGIGSECMAFDISLTKLLPNWNIKFTPYDTNLLFSLSEIARFQALRDSLVVSFFNSSRSKSPYLNSVRSLYLKDNYFGSLNYFLELAVNTNISYSTSDSILKNYFHFDKAMLVDSNLYSKEFQTFLTRHYVRHISKFDLEHDYNLATDRFHTVSVILKYLSGDLKERALYSYFVSSISNSSNVEDYDGYVAHYNSNKSQISNTNLIFAIDEAIQAKYKELSESTVGSLAPNFSAVDLEGNLVYLQDFKGKVVYIDLWASWCLPCRKETPHLEEIYSHFKGDSTMVILGISVFDKPNAWRKAVEQDEAKWLQLFDEKGKVSGFFNGVIEIPKFILINKLGNIVSFNAPLPHEKDVLIKLLSQELNK